MDRVFELAHDRRELVFHLAELAKSNDYYRRIHPTEAAATDAARAEEFLKTRAKKVAAPAPPSLDRKAATKAFCFAVSLITRIAVIGEDSLPRIAG